MDGAVCLPTQVKGRDVSGNIHSSFTLKPKARNLSFQKLKSKRKSKLAKLFQEVQKKILKKADYSLNRFADMYLSLPPHFCHPFYKSCNQGESAQLTQLHSQVRKTLLETVSTLSVLFLSVLVPDLSCDPREMPFCDIGERQSLQSFKGKILHIMVFSW